MRNQKILAPLEELPTELLQRIFLESRTIRLRHASSILLALLNHAQLMKKLFISLFGHGRSSLNGSGDLEIDFPLFQDSKEIGVLQSLFAASEWFTLSFMRQCQLEYLTREGEKVIKYSLGDEHRNRRHEVSLTYKDWLRDLDAAVDHYRGLSHSNPRPFVFAIILGSEDPQKDPLTFLKIARDFRSIHLAGQLPSSLDPVHLRSPFILPHFSSFFVIPKKLLHYPMTEEQLLLLQMINDDCGGECCSDDSICEYGSPHQNFDKSIASQVLEKAIRQYDGRVITILAEWPKGYHAEIDIMAYQRDRTLSLDGLPIKDETTGKRSEYWKLLRTDTEEKHLLAALETAEIRGDIDAKVFCWLIPRAQMLGKIALKESQDGPSTTQEFRKVLTWITRKLAQDQEEGVIHGIGERASAAVKGEQPSWIFQP